MLSPKRKLHEKDQELIIKLYNEGGRYYESLPVRPTKFGLTNDQKSNRKYQIRNEKLIAGKITRKPSIGQLARQFKVNKTVIKKILGLQKVRPEPYRERTVSGKLLPKTVKINDMISVKLPDDPAMRDLAERVLHGN